MGRKKKINLARRKTSSIQFDIMLKYFEKNNDLLQEKFEPWRADLKKKWKELACLLNAEDSGPTKDVEKWRKTFKHWKSYVKGKARKIEIHKRSGRIDPCKETLSSLDEKLLALLEKNISSEDKYIYDLLIQKNYINLDIIDHDMGTSLESLDNTNHAYENEVSYKEHVPSSSSSFNLKCSKEEKESFLQSIGTNVMESQSKLVNVQNRRLEASLKELGALERIALAKEREACIAEELYLLKKKKIDELYDK